MVAFFSKITLVKLMFTGSGALRTQRPSAFVEFKDEESMNVALGNNSGVSDD